MAHNTQTRAAVRAAYIFEMLPLSQIATAHGVPLATLRSWKKRALDTGDDWDKLRGAQALAGEGVESIARQMVADYVVQHKALMEAVLTAKDINPAAKVAALASLADSFNKMLAASKRVLPETGELAVALRVLRLLGEYVQREYPQHANALLEVLEPFAAGLPQTLGAGGHG
ncbi:DUF1804 family protein [uncultured Desulfovibrio sp.]|mgnify:FL=1|uniref:DUF1804 family protein n=1 Tax=uncultured Desulfovibrio sp. TaxID=167968 RepID=UPI002053F7E0|nr:DUF1804 family protein [uncultured Desulfovibrio sp.]DAJ56698.1 MAG TPA: Protein of unknown function (DUF1804) [Caudoviricetes sp.]